MFAKFQFMGILTIGYPLAIIDVHPMDYIIPHTHFLAIRHIDSCVPIMDDIYIIIDCSIYFSTCSLRNQYQIHFPNTTNWLMVDVRASHSILIKTTKLNENSIFYIFYRTTQIGWFILFICYNVSD